MSDFLTRLAERTLGVAPTVQPVLAPLFAPSPLVAEEWIASDVSGFVAEQDGDIRRRVPVSWVPTRGTPTMDERTHRWGTQSSMVGVPLVGTHFLGTHKGHPSTSAVGADVSRPGTGSSERTERHAAFEQTNQAMADVGTDVSHPPTGTYTQPERHSAFEQTNQVTTDAGTDVSRPDTGIYTQPERHSAFEQTNQVTTDVGTDVSRPDTETYTQPERHSAFEQTNQVTTDVGTDVSRPPTYTQPGRDKSVPTAPNSLTRRNSLARRTGIATAGVSKPPGVVQQRTSMRMEHVPSTTLEVESIPSEHAQTRGASQQEHTALVPPGNQRITPHVTSEGERILPEQNSVVSRNEQRAMPTPELSVSAPTIQVTIGRIEVRAMTPPAPPARPKPSRPDTGLSLDDYLDQYNGRKR